MKNLKKFQLSKGAENILGGLDSIIAGGTWQKSYAKNDPDKTYFFRDYVD